MTQTAIDPKHASIEQCRIWLAEEPCRCSEGLHDRCEDGLAFPWASRPCTNSWHKKDYYESMGYFVPGPEVCKSSCVAGRVPKDVGLTELWEYGGLTMVRRNDLHFDASRPGKSFGASCGTTESIAKGETPTLAALRAVVTSRLSRI